MKKSGSETGKDHARCVRLLLGGKVSCDHFLQEYGKDREGPFGEAVRLVEGVAAGGGRYRRPAHLTAEEARRLEELAAEMEGGS